MNPIAIAHTKNQTNSDSHKAMHLSCAICFGTILLQLLLPCVYSGLIQIIYGLILNYANICLYKIKNLTPLFMIKWHP